MCLLSFDTKIKHISNHLHASVDNCAISVLAIQAFIDAVKSYSDSKNLSQEQILTAILKEQKSEFQFFSYSVVAHGPATHKNKPQNVQSNVGSHILSRRQLLPCVNEFK